MKAYVLEVLWPGAIVNEDVWQVEGVYSSSDMASESGEDFVFQGAKGYTVTEFTVGEKAA